jgi:signal transduction histidine kinase/ligand-binding sensor domain-containing protein
MGVNPLNSRKLAMGIHGAGLILACTCLTGLAQRVDPKESPAISPAEVGYSLIHWTIEDGLPLDRVSSITQTTEGFLWIGTDAGVLARFDGAEFRLIPTTQPEASLQRYVGLLEDSEGRLWLRGSAGAVARYFEGRFESIEDLEHPSQRDTGPMAEAGDGAVWMAGRNPARFYRFSKDGTLNVIEPAEPERGRYATALAADPHGEVWGIWNDRTLFKLAENAPVDVPLTSPSGEAVRNLGGLMTLPAGGLAVVSSAGIYQQSKRGWELSRPAPLKDLQVRHAVGVEGGSFWMTTTSNELVHLSSDGHLAPVSIRGTGGPILYQGLFRDDQGNIWIMTHQGLFQLSRVPVRTWTVADGLPAARVLSITAEPDGTVWARARFDGIFTRLPTVNGKGEVRNIDVGVWARFIARRPDDSLWVVSQAGELWVRDSERTLPVGRLAMRGQPAVVHDLLVSRQGDAWFATELGLFKWDRTLQTAVPHPGSLSTLSIRALVEDNTGRVYVGTEAGLFAINGETRCLSSPDQRQSVNVICADDEGAIWAICRRNQLARWKAGKWSFFSDRSIQRFRHIISIMADDQDGLWLGTESKGVVWLDRAVLNEIAAGGGREFTAIELTRKDGLASLACAGFSRGMAKTPDGRIWVATANGASVIDPAAWKRLREASMPPRVRLDEVLIDDTAADLGTNASAPPTRRTSRPSVRVPPGRKRVEIRYAAIDLQAAERCAFRYRLIGYVDDWQEAGTRRSALFHRLPPGGYTFEVIAANPYGVWNASPASLALTVSPSWWQTPLFRIVVASLVLSGLWIGRSIRIRRIEVEKRRQAAFTQRVIESQETERQRIARELHDGLGQGLMLIKNTAQLTLRHVEEDSPAMARMVEVSRLASGAINDVRAIMSNLRPPELDRLGLTDALEAMMDAVRNATSASIESRIERIDGLWMHDQEIHLYRIIQELINNALKHAGASRIELRVSRSESSVIVRISDNGRGFRPEAAPAPRPGQGLGLAGARERVRFLSGHIEIESAPGAGARVQVSLPIPGESKKQERVDPCPDRG